MINVEREIGNKNLERVNSIYYQFVDDTDLIKGVADDLGYSTDLNINKKGKEIKEKINQDLGSLNVQKSGLLIEMKSYISKIGIIPLIDISDQYPVKSYINVLNAIPYKYCRSQMYPEGSSYDSLEDEDKVRIANMAKYNQSVEKYARLCIDILKLNTVVNNIQDNKSYRLNLDLASKLGF